MATAPTLYAGTACTENAIDKHDQARADVSATLRRVHKALLDAEARTFEPALSPFELLELTIHDPHFAWLRRLSELLVGIDERRDADTPVDAEQAAAIRAAIEGLTGPPAASDERFRTRYNAALQNSPMPCSPTVNCTAFSNNCRTAKQAKRPPVARKGTNEANRATALQARCCVQGRGIAACVNTRCREKVH